MAASCGAGLSVGSGNLSDVEPDSCRLNDEGTVVRDPDYIMQFVVHEDSE
jgi:hypothetical protein